MIISLGPKKVENQTFQKEATFPVIKVFWPIFSRIIECDKLQGTICKDRNGFVPLTVEVISLFLSDLRNC